MIFMRWRFITFLCLLLISLSCSVQNHDSEDILIKGTLLNAGSGAKLYFEELTTSEVLLIDSIILTPDGSFSLQKQIDDAGFYILRLDYNNSITLLLEPGEQVTILGDATNLSTGVEITGSVGSLLLLELNMTLRENLQVTDSLIQVFRQRRYDDDFLELRKELDAAFADVFSEHQAYVKEFIAQNSHSLASVIALYQVFGNRLVLRESEHFSYYEELSKSLAEAYPYNKHVIDLKRRVAEYRRTAAQRQLIEENLMPGAIAPDILLPDPEGNQVALSSLRGKVVLIDFWAAWCTPCRRANKYLKSIYEEYNPLGFEIYAVSLDRTFDQWLMGIEEDDIDWIHVSDLRFWNSPVVTQYNVESIPHAILIDADGHIIQKGIRPRELREKLDQLLRSTASR